MIWEMLHPWMTMEMLGLIPSFISDDDKRPAKEQFDKAYVSGWHPMKGFVHKGDYVLEYSGDPLYKPLAKTSLRDETIVFYPYAWVAIFQPDGSYEVSRMD